jgi:hypothetical protein
MCLVAWHTQTTGELTRHVLLGGSSALLGILEVSRANVL